MAFVGRYRFSDELEEVLKENYFSLANNVFEGEVYLAPAVRIAEDFRDGYVSEMVTRARLTRWAELSRIGMSLEELLEGETETLYWDLPYKWEIFSDNESRLHEACGMGMTYGAALCAFLVRQPDVEVVVLMDLENPESIYVVKAPRIDLCGDDPHMDRSIFPNTRSCERAGQDETYVLPLEIEKEACKLLAQASTP